MYMKGKKQHNSSMEGQSFINFFFEHSVNEMHIAIDLRG